MGSVSIDDVSILEGDGGATIFSFTVSRTGGTAAFSVDFATADGTASSTADADYVANSGTLSFGQDELTKTVSVTINGDAIVEGDETFFVNLSSATGGPPSPTARASAPSSTTMRPTSRHPTSSPAPTATISYAARRVVALALQGAIP